MGTKRVGWKTPPPDLELTKKTEARRRRAAPPTIQEEITMIGRMLGALADQLSRASRGMRAEDDVSVVGQLSGYAAELEHLAQAIQTLSVQESE